MKVLVQLKSADLHSKSEYVFERVKDVQFRDSMFVIVDNTDFGHTFNVCDIKRVHVENELDKEEEREAEDPEGRRKTAMMHLKDSRKSRCMDCASLIEGSHGAWVCDELNLEIHEIGQDECPYGLTAEILTADMVTGTIGQWIEADEIDIPEAAVQYLRKAYDLCAEAL